MALKPRVKALVRVTLGLALIFALLYAVDFRELWTVLAEVDPWWLIGVLVFPHLAILVSVIKWRWLLKAQDLHYRHATLFRLYLIGTFFSNFLPSMVGGDVVRGYLLGAGGESAPHVTAAIFVERLSGMAALVCLLLFAVCDQALQARFPLVVGLLAAAIGAAVIGALAVYRGKRLQPSVLASHPALQNRVMDFIKRTRRRVGDYRNHQGVLLRCFLISFPFYFFAMAAVYSAGRAVGADIDVWTLLVVVPVVLFIGLLPISVNGMGVTETGWVVFLGLYGLSPALGLALGLLLRARILLTSALGGLLYATLKQRMSAESGTATESQA